MSKPVTVQTYMTPTPLTIGSDQPIPRAAALMREHKVRHLPVLRGGALVGLLSERDVRLVEGLSALDKVNVLVDDAMTSEPYVVSPNATLDEVASAMADHKYGSVVVADNGKVVGIFTVTDACRALSALLDGRLEK